MGRFAFTSDSIDDLPPQQRKLAQRALEHHAARRIVGTVKVHLSAISPASGRIELNTAHDRARVLHAAAAILDRAPAHRATQEVEAVSTSPAFVTVEVNDLHPPKGSMSWTAGSGTAILAAARELILRDAGDPPPPLPPPTPRERLRNLDFSEGATSDGFPMFWQEDEGPADHHLDPHGAPDGSACLDITCAHRPPAYAAIFQPLDPTSLHGRTLRWSADLSTRNVDGDGARLSLLAFADTALHSAAVAPDQPLTGDSPWTRHSVHLTIPTTATHLTLGCFLAGAGTLRAAHFDIELLR